MNDIVFIINGNPAIEWNKNQMIFHKKHAFFLSIKMKPLIEKPFSSSDFKQEILIA